MSTIFQVNHYDHYYDYYYSSSYCIIYIKVYIQNDILFIHHTVNNIVYCEEKESIKIYAIARVSRRFLGVCHVAMFHQQMLPRYSRQTRWEARSHQHDRRNLETKITSRIIRGKMEVYSMYTWICRWLVGGFNPSEKY